MRDAEGPSSSHPARLSAAPSASVRHREAEAASLAADLRREAGWRGRQRPSLVVRGPRGLGDSLPAVLPCVLVRARSPLGGMPVPEAFAFLGLESCMPRGRVRLAHTRQWQEVRVVPSRRHPQCPAIRRPLAPLRVCPGGPLSSFTGRTLLPCHPHARELALTFN